MITVQQFFLSSMVGFEPIVEQVGTVREIQHIEFVQAFTTTTGFEQFSIKRHDYFDSNSPNVILMAEIEGGKSHVVAFISGTTFEEMLAHYPARKEKEDETDRKHHIFPKAIRRKNEDGSFDALISPIGVPTIGGYVITHTAWDVMKENLSYRADAKVLFGELGQGLIQRDLDRFRRIDHGRVGVRIENLHEKPLPELGEGVKGIFATIRPFGPLEQEAKKLLAEQPEDLCLGLRGISRSSTTGHPEVYQVINWDLIAKQ